MFVWMIFSPCVQSCLLSISWTAQSFFTKLCMVLLEAMCHVEKLVHYVQFQGLGKGLYNQNMTFYCGKMGLLRLRSWSLLRTVQSVSECLSGWYFLNYRTFCYQIWYCDAASWARVPCRIFFFFFGGGIFKVKVILRAHMIKIWLFIFSELLIPWQPNLIADTSS